MKEGEWCAICLLETWSPASWCGLGGAAVRALLPRGVRRRQVAPEAPDVPALPRWALATAAASDATAGMTADATTRAGHGHLSSLACVFPFYSGSFSMRFVSTICFN